MPTLPELLGADTLTGTIQEIQPGLAPETLPPQFYTPDTFVEGDQGSYRKVQGTRALARFVAYGSKSVRREQKGVSEVPVKLLHSFENQEFKPQTLLNLKDANEQRQKMAQAEIARQTGDFKQMFFNTRIAAVQSSLANGKIWVDGDGNLLASSSGAAYTIDFGIPDGNQGSLDVLGAGAIIGASWATAGTDIPTQIKKLKAASRKKTGYQIRHAFYGVNIFSYLLSNNYVSKLVASNAAFAQSFNSGEIPEGFLGIKWHPADEAFMIDTDGVSHDFWAADKIAFTPEVGKDWYSFIEGSYPVPTSLNVSADAAEAVANIKLVSGMFSYAKVTDDPVGITQYAGDTYLPVIKNPLAVFIGDVTP